MGNQVERPGGRHTVHSVALRDNAAMLHILETFPCRRTDAGGNVLLIEFPIW